MSNSWDKYFAHYSDWDEAHCFNVRLELKFEEEIQRLGYVEYVNSDDIYLIDHNFSNKTILYIYYLRSKRFPHCLHNE